MEPQQTASTSSEIFMMLQAPKHKLSSLSDSDPFGLNVNWVYLPSTRKLLGGLKPEQSAWSNREHHANQQMFGAWWCSSSCKSQTSNEHSPVLRMYSFQLRWRIQKMMAHTFVCLTYDVFSINKVVGSLEGHEWQQNNKGGNAGDVGQHWTVWLK